MIGSNQPASGRSQKAITFARVGDVGIALLGGGRIAGFGSPFSTKLGLCAGPIHDPDKDAG